MVEEPEDIVYKRKPNLAWMYAGAPPVVVPLKVFLRKSPLHYDEPDRNVSRFVRTNPLFSIPPLLIILGSGPSNRAVGIPTIVGGAQRLQIFIGGVDVTDCSSIDRSLVAGLGFAVGAQALQVNSQTLGRWTAQFDIYDIDGTYNPELAQTLLIQENGQRLLAGCISTLIVEKPYHSVPFRVFHVTANDKTYRFDQRQVLAPFILAGTDIADVIRSLFTDSTFCNPPLSTEGITYNSIPASLGPLSTDILPYLWSVTRLMDALSDDLAGVWWIDTLSDLHMDSLPDIGTAPFALSETDTQPTFRAASMKTSLDNYRTKQYVLSDRNITPEPSSSGITGTSITETWTLPQPLAQSLGYLPDAIVTNFPILKITKLTVDGVEQPVYVQTQYPFINLRHTWFYAPQTPYLTGPNVQNQNPFPDPDPISPDPSPGAVIVIEYIAPQQQTQVTTNDPLAPSFGLCGSGIFEAVEQVKGIDKASDLKNLADALIAKFGGILPKELSYQTNRSGLQVGQRQTVDLPSFDLAATTLMITSVQGTVQSGVLEWGSRFSYTVVATNTADQGDWLKYYERLLRRTENGPPLQRYEAIQFILEPGGSIAAGLVSTNPYIVKNSGQLIRAVACALVAPVDQDLVIDVLSAQQGSLLGGPTPLTVTAGSNVILFSITQFTNDPAPLYLYKDDILTCTVSYNVTGPNPAPAESVTVDLQLLY